MQSRVPICIAAVLVSMAAGGAAAALAGDRDNLMPLTLAGGMAEMTAQGEGRLAALSARQQLRDEVCIAMADGRVTHFERAMILAHARRILKSEEFGSFKESLDYLSPPPVARRPANFARGGTPIGRPATAQPRYPSTASGETVVTDRMATNNWMR